MNKTEAAEKLKAARIRKGMTQVQVAASINKSPKLVGHWETGYSQPDVENLAILFQLYEMDANTFFEIEKAPVRELVLNKEEEELIQLYRQCDKPEKGCIVQSAKSFAELAIRRTQAEAPHGSGTDKILQTLWETAQQKDSQTELPDASKKQ